MRILGINGVWCHTNPIWNTLVPAFKEKFPDAQFVIEEDSGCWPTEVRRMRKFVDHLYDKYDDGVDALLVGHSMGGIYASALANRFQRSTVRGVVTIFSPHSFLGGVFPLVLGVTPLKAPIVSFRATRDMLVWWGTKHRQSIAHTDLSCDHFVQLSRSKELAEKIADDTKKALF